MSEMHYWQTFSAKHQSEADHTPIMLASLAIISSSYTQALQDMYILEYYSY